MSRFVTKCHDLSSLATLGKETGKEIGKEKVKFYGIGLASRPLTCNLQPATRDRNPSTGDPSWCIMVQNRISLGTRGIP
jgi:hypothetical protein